MKNSGLSVFRWPPYLQAFFVFFFLLLSTWKVSAQLETKMDLRFYDESYYLTQGLFHSPESWLADYSPLYSLWYKLAGYFISDPVELYDAAYRFWTFALGLMVFGLVRVSSFESRERNRWFIALLWGMASIASQLALPLWPKAGHLAMIGSFIGIFGLLNWKDEQTSQLCWVAGIGLLFSWCRPEFLAAAGTAGLLIPLAILSGERKFSYLSLIPFVPALACWYIWGLPTGQSGRGLVAFGQHFVHNWRNISGNNQTDLMHDWVNWRPIFASHFGNAGNPVEAFLTNPGDMIRHLWFNLRYLIYNCLVYFSETMFPKRITGISPVYGFAALLLLAEWMSKLRTADIFFQRFRKRNFREFLPWLVLALPALLAGFLFQPRPHYLLPLFPFFILLVTIFFKPVAILQNHKVSFLLPIALPIMLFFLLPDSDAFFRLKTNANSGFQKTNPDQNEHFEAITSPSLRHRKLVKELQAYPFADNFHLFDGSTGATEFLGKKVIQCGKTGFELNYDAIRNFSFFLDSARVEGIFLNESIHYDDFFNRNFFWQQLRSRSEEMGWIKLAIGRGGDSLLIRKNKNSRMLPGS